MWKTTDGGDSWITTTDALLSLAIANKTPVLTVDKTLKRRLHEANASVIEVLASRTLRFIE